MERSCEMIDVGGLEDFTPRTKADKVSVIRVKCAWLCASVENAT